MQQDIDQISPIIIILIIIIIMIMIIITIIIIIDATGYWSNKPDCEETESSINLHRSLHIHRRPGAAIHWISAFVVISNIFHLIVSIIIIIILTSHHSHDPVLISLAILKNPGGWGAGFPL